jgi:hypothetical protein
MLADCPLFPIYKKHVADQWKDRIYCDMHTRYSSHKPMQYLNCIPGIGLVIFANFG